ncbi:MAG: hypothetical protein V2I76_06655 [Roseobacter sp.]|nr:hypothetical protein [Roseobacter sp.]
MSKPTEKSVFKTSKPVAETPMDKTTRIVREITEEEAAQRQVKMARLRKARLERDANTPREPKSPRRRSTGKQAATKTIE